MRRRTKSKMTRHRWGKRVTILAASIEAESAAKSPATVTLHWDGASLRSLNASQREGLIEAYAAHKQNAAIIIMGSLRDGRLGIEYCGEPVGNQ